jgi:hypothetical protein
MYSKNVSYLWLSCKEIIMGILGYYLLTDPYADLKRENETWKERIKREFRESMNLPRKKKKQKRKELQLHWNIANYDPFKF